MTQSEHVELVKQESDGTIRFGIDRAHARQFYTDIPIRVVEEQTGETPYFEKVVVYLCWLGSPVALVVSSWFAVTAFHWWSVLIIPVTLMIWLMHATRSAAGTSRLLGGSLVLAGGVALYLFLPGARKFALFLSAFSLALWLHRFLYIGATHFLRSFIIRNHRAFAYLHKCVTIGRA